MEGKVYLCSWRKTNDGFDVWLVGRPKIRASGATFDYADDALIDAIMDATGDGENHREYDPPRPLSAEAVSLVERVVNVVGASRGRVDDSVEYYDGGLCNRCGIPRGPRNEQPLRLADVRVRGDAGSAYIPTREYTPGVYFYSEAFLKRLSRSERSAVEWREVQVPKRKRKRFFEPISAKREIPLVVVKTKRPVRLQRCERCGHRFAPMYGEPADLSEPYWFVSFQHFTTGYPSIFALRGNSDLSLCFTRDRWRALRGKPGTQELGTMDVGVVAESQVVKRPKYKPYTG